MSNPTNKIASRHTPEPWLIDPVYGDIIRQWDKEFRPEASPLMGDSRGAIVIDAESERARRNAESKAQQLFDFDRAVSCVNALAGMNPEAVKDVVNALEESLSAMETHDDIKKVFFQGEIKQARAALAALKGSK